MSTRPHDHTGHHDASAPACNMAAGFLLGVVLAGAGAEPAAAQRIRSLNDLNFGMMAACAVPGSVTIAPQDGSRSTTSCINPLGGVYNAGRFWIFTRSFQFRQVVLSAWPATAVLSNAAGDTMSVDDFNLVTDAGGPAHTITVRFFDDFHVGARLNLKAMQPGGTYSGSYSISANYL